MSRPFPEKDKIGFVVEWTPLGEIDSAGASFSPLSPVPEIKGNFFVVRQPAGEPAGWRIEGPMGRASVTVDAAIRYVTELRKNAANDTVRKNADRPSPP